MSDDTPWAAGRFDARARSAEDSLRPHVRGSAIEQPRLLPAGASSASPRRAAWRWRSHRAIAVTAVDINPVQLAYAEQRAAGGPMRIGRPSASSALGRRLMAPFGWRRRPCGRFSPSNSRGQMAFWHRHLNTAGFRVAADLLLSLAWLRLVSTPCRFSRSCRPLRPGDAPRLERCWTRIRTAPIRTLARCSSASFRHARRPAAEPIRFVCADAASFLESCPPGSFDGFTLSNILDGAPASYRQRLFAAIRHAGTPEASSSCAASPNRTGRATNQAPYATARSSGASSTCVRCPELTASPQLSHRVSRSRARRISLVTSSLRLGRRR